MLKGLCSLSIIAFILVACATISTVPGASTRVYTPAYSEEAFLHFCAGDIKAAREIAGHTQFIRGDTRFFEALLLEASGHPVPARQAYAVLAMSQGDEQVFIRCADKVWANGLVSEEAGKRLAILAQELRAMGVIQGIPTELHRGLPGIRRPVTIIKKPAAVRTPKRAKSLGALVDIIAPLTASPTGRWFAHLSSYMSAENAAKYRRSLDAKYPALKGMIEAWIVATSKGSVWRLGVRTYEWRDADKLCISVRGTGQYCRVIDTR